MLAHDELELHHRASSAPQPSACESLALPFQVAFSAHLAVGRYGLGVITLDDLCSTSALCMLIRFCSTPSAMR